jgi:hypothetical protein
MDRKESSETPNQHYTLIVEELLIDAQTSPNN